MANEDGPPDGARCRRGPSLAVVERNDRPGGPDWLPDLLPGSVTGGLRAALAGKGAPVLAAALSPVGRALALAAVAREARRPLLVVVADDATARGLARELDALLSPSGIPALRLPRLDADPWRGIPAHPAVAAERVAVLDRLAGSGSLVLVAPIDALLVPVPGPATVRSWGREIAVGAEVDLDDLARELVAGGWRAADVVTSPGDFARRGGVFDAWPPQEDAPLRVELFGDEVESIRRFDPATQRTSGRVTRFRVLPAREAPIGPEQADRLLDRLVGRAREILAEAPATEEGLPRLLEEMLAGLEGAPRLYRDDVVALDAWPGLVPVAWEPDEALERLAAAWADLEAAHREAGEDRLPPPRETCVPPERLRRLVRGAPVAFSAVPLAGPGRETIDLGARPAPSFGGKLADVLPVLRGQLARGGRAVLLARAPGRLDRLAEVLAEGEIPHRRVDEDQPWPPGPGEVALVQGALPGGVELPGEDGPGRTGSGVLVLTDLELFGPEPPPPPPRRRRGGEAFLSDLRDLKEGDLVVHVDHGIGRYLGLTRRPGTGEELLVLEYAEGSRLYVPVTRLDLVQKYSGGEAALVPLDRLGGPGWEKRRRKVRKAVEEIAGELLELYAKRKAARAHAFGPDTDWQREFEAAFPHELTPDQAAALAEIKADLCRDRPMDRLLCGDVGYGKTEVALRAAFKVIQEGYQVAVLVPTTVLAFQHLRTFRARMAGWPVRVEMVSRFVSPRETREILAATERGEVDVLVGTHRLLGRDVRFRKLGLLVIDEEQRFGVRHKEAIKRLALGVHVLSMSATPIPRTLQMSLAGVRDLSVIETPPRNRLAIQTRLVPWTASLVAAAIRNELRRGGQVFYVYPRVRGIEEVVHRLRELVPEARIVHAHGQMPEGRLEGVMLDFVQGKADVLVATTIIENGLDIPRANTILVHDAHRFGLSQLYQMRGRVGRSDVRAWAWLLVPDRRQLTADARRRLAALVEFSDLGAGFRIAAMDLEIRGAGELLGARQSGHIAAVGFEMYARLLEEAVRKLRGEPPGEEPEPVAINLGIEAFLPEDYVPEPGHRLEVYKRLSRAATEEELRDLEEEVRDRFGRPPEPVRNLFRVAALRLAAAAQGAVAIDWLGDAVAVRYGEQPRVAPERIVRLVQEDPDVRLSPTGVVRVRVMDPGMDRVAAASLALRKMAS